MIIYIYYYISSFDLIKILNKLTDYLNYTILKINLYMKKFLFLFTEINKGFLNI